MALGRPHPLSDSQFSHLLDGDKLNLQGCCENLGIINVEVLGKRTIAVCRKESRLILGTASTCEGQVSLNEDLNRVMHTSGK